MTADSPAGHYVEYLPIDDVLPADRNPKAHDRAGISRSIAHHGVAELPLIDDRTGRLIAGHGRLDQLVAMRDGGKKPPAGVRLDDAGAWLMPVLRGWASRSDEDAAAYLIASNRLTEVGGWDDRELAEMLADLADVDMLELTGYDPDDLDDLIAGLQEAEPQDGDGADSDEDDPLAGQTRQTRGLDDLKDDYEASSQRVLVLSYAGEVYVWAVNQLAELMQEMDVETNSEAVVALIERATGKPAPVAADEGGRG